jgi:NAD(P)-dependent dehydrogenase (short-subunit alcohol dehydrogenase family)
MNNIFDLSGKTALITGAGGLLGPKHAEAILDFGGKVILTDWHLDRVKEKADLLSKKYGEENVFYDFMDVCDKNSIEKCVSYFESQGLQVDILINNAAKDPKVKKEDSIKNDSRFENMSEKFWKEGTDAAINGTFLVSQTIVNRMLQRGIKGVILNISSDLGVIAPDQRIYRKPDLTDEEQPVKPITYSAAKWAIIGITKYLAVYFAKKGIRVNCLSPTGVYNNHPEDFVEKLSNIIPMGRMANIDEYKGAIVFLCSEASSYMTGENMVIDGGKTVW